MANKAGRCRNYDGCTKALQNEIINVDEFNFFCPECGGSLKPLSHTALPKGPNKVFIGAVVIAVVMAIGGSVYLLRPKGNESDGPNNPVIPELLEPAHPDADFGLAKCTPQPLLMDGKRSLHQRILTRPDAILSAQPGETGGKKVQPLNRFYVYARSSTAGEEWLQVGASTNCHTEGWIRAKHTVPWKQQITVAFDNPAGRDRVLLFQSDKNLSHIAKSPQPAKLLDPILNDVRQGKFNQNVISAEPENYIDFTKKFYLLPIINFKEIKNNDGYSLNLLNIHSITQTSEQIPPQSPQAVPPKAAVVFVIDSTISMAPYIERTKEAVKQIFERLHKPPVGNGINFGLVAFRSSIKAVPKLDYVSHLFVDPNKPDNEQTFKSGIDQVREADISSASFDEDPYAGIKQALDINWTPYLNAARHIVLITDAGALDAGDPLSSTHQSADEIRSAAADKHVTLYALHLKTRAGLNDHAKAKNQYDQLTRNVLTGESLYYEVDNAEDIAGFGTAIDCATRSMMQNIVNANQATDAGKQNKLAEACPPQPNNPPLDEQINKMRQHAEILGLALALEFKGLLPYGMGAPKDIEGWISDRDLKSPVRPNVEIKLLLTKNELSNLAQGVKAILDAAKIGASSPDQFYKTLNDFAVKMARNPDQARSKENITIADMGLLGEYLDDLPYKSQVMSIGQDTWENWSTSQQDEFIRSIENKLERYQYYDSHDELWQKLTSTDDEGDKVYPVPLDALP